VRFFMNKRILSFFAALSEKEITYCHFKSNNNLKPALEGIDDLDLLVKWANIDDFMGTVQEFGFRPAFDRHSVPTPFVYHFFGFDDEEGLLIHLHVYFRIVTGGSILKNHWIQVEDMLLDESRPEGVGGVFIPSAEADLILFVIRKFIEQTSIVEHFLFLRDWDNIRAELNWLNERASRSSIRALLAKWIPGFSSDLFEAGLDLLIRKGTVVQRVCLGRKMNRFFQNKVYSSLKASLIRSAMFFHAYSRGKLGFTRQNRSLFPGGMLIAFTGSEASGKSTLSKETAHWLHSRFDVTRIHLGKPPKNWRTRPFWAGIRLFSLAKRFVRFFYTFSRDGKAKHDRVSNNLPHPVVCWLDSIDRVHSVREMVKRMMEGSLVMTDRYPSEELGGLDGARILPNSYVTRWLSLRERENYSCFPTPDIVFCMIAPLELTLHRNSLRESPEPEEFVRQRFELARKINFKRSRMVEIDTTVPLEDSVLSIRRAIWRVFSSE
jgi:thymidylate kinase